MNDIGFNRGLFHALTVEKANGIKSGIWGFTQREFAFNSNKIEGSRLTKEHTSSLFNTGSIYVDGEFRAKDIEETTGHFAMFNVMLDTLNSILSEDLIKLFHRSLKQGVFEDIANGYAIGDYKTRRNFVGDIDTALPSEVPERMSKLLSQYWTCEKSLKNLAIFHAEYERIHPFQDGNGMVGRIIMFRECLTHGVIPFIIRHVNAKEYIDALVLAQNGNVEPLVGYFMKEQKWYAKKVSEILGM